MLKFFFGPEQVVVESAAVGIVSLRLFYKWLSLNSIKRTCVIGGRANLFSVLKYVVHTFNVEILIF